MGLEDGWGLGFRVWGSGLRVQSLGLRVPHLPVLSTWLLYGFGGGQDLAQKIAYCAKASLVLCSDDTEKQPHACVYGQQLRCHQQETGFSLCCKALLSLAGALRLGPVHVQTKTLMSQITIQRLFEVQECRQRK